MSLITVAVERSCGTFVLKGWASSKSAKWRILYAHDRQVYSTSLNHDIQPTLSYTDTGLVDCQWELADQKPILVESGMPNWHMPLGLVHYGEYGTWNDVAQWASRLFYASSEVSPEFQEIVNDIAASTDSFDERIRLALRFVQDDIRYVSISVGEHSTKPYDVTTILERRYGDCKDKASLLSALLRALGIDALPALVNTFRRQQIAHSLPSPREFNHVITRVQHENKTYWFDATIQGQRGALDKIFCPPYGKALVISPETQNLEDISSFAGRHSTLKIVESFKIHQSHDSDEFSVSRIYEGHYADIMRNRIANSSPEQIERDFLNDYLMLYPHTKVARPWSFRDDEAANRIEVSFEYHVNNLWHPVPNQRGMCGANFYATGIHYVLNKPPANTRRTPYAIAHPNNIENHLIIRTTRPLRFSRGRASVECDAFKYKWQREVVSNALHFTMQYTSNKDHVMPGELTKYLKAINQVAEHVRQGVILNIPSHRHTQINPRVRSPH